MDNCIWNRKSDSHFSIGCVIKKNGLKANKNFKPDNKNKKTKWNFKYCPYCGKEIEIMEG